MPPEPKPSRRKLAEVALSLALLAAMVPAAWWFLREPGKPAAPAVPGQVVTPKVTLTADERAAVANVPRYHDTIPVLTYHDVSPTHGKYRVTPEQFAKQMAALDQAGFHTVTAEQVRALVAGESPKLPTNPILITFDDGIRGIWTYADPILAQHGFNAVAFLVSGAIPDDSNSYYLDWETIRRMLRTGRWEVGGHSDHGHRVVDAGAEPAPWISNLEQKGKQLETLDHWQARVSADLTRNHEVLESKLHTKVVAFAYPFSAAGFPTNDPEIAQRLPLLVASRFDLAFVNTSSAVGVDAASERAHLQRITSVQDTSTVRSLLAAVSDTVGRSTLGDLVGPTRPARGSGRCLRQGKDLRIDAVGYAACDLATPLSARWHDVTLSTTLRRMADGATAFFRVRQSEGDRVDIAVSDENVVVRQVTGGTWRTLSTRPLANRRGPATLKVNIRLEGSRLQVSIGTTVVADVSLDPRLDHGTMSVAATGRDHYRTTFGDLTLRPIEG